MNADRQPARLLKIKEVAEFLQVSTKTIRRRIRSGELRVFRDGRVLRIELSELRRYIAANQ